MGTRLSAKLCFDAALGMNLTRSESAGKQSFRDKCVPKLELGNEGLGKELEPLPDRGVLFGVRAEF